MENKNCTTLKFKNVHLKHREKYNSYSKNSLLKQQMFCVFILTPYATTGYWYE